MTEPETLPQAGKENKMGVTPIPKLLLNMAAPMVVSMLILACYNVVDSYFVAQISENAVTALSLAFPIQNLLMAVSLGLAVGVNALLARFLGQKQQDMVNRVAMQGLLLAAIGYVLFLLLGAFGMEVYMRNQTDIAEIAAYGTDYLRICLMVSIGVFIQVTFERILQATGRTLCTMMTQGFGALLNIVLDPIFIFTLDFGVSGAAIATVISQCMGALLAFLVNKKMNPDVHFRLKNLPPDWKMMGKILYIGIPSMLMMSVSSVMVFCMNWILIGFSTTAVAVYGLYFKMQSFVLMPAMGMNNGMMPILAYNYGAGNIDRIPQTIQLAAKIDVCFLVLGLLIFQIFPAQLLLIFDASPYLLEIGVPALRIISLHFPVAALCIPLSGSFQALGRSMYSLYTSLARQLGALIPLAWVLSLSGSLDAVWFSYLGAELISLTMSLIFAKKTMAEIHAQFHLPKGHAWPKLKA